MKEITSLSNPYIKELSKLKDKKYLEKSDVFLVEGKHLVEEAYKNGCLKQVLSDDESMFIEGVDCVKVSYDIIKKITDTVNPQNIIGLVSKFNNEIDIENIKSVVILDGVSDPGNVGTIIRTAAGLGIDLVVLSNDSVDLYNPKVVRSTQGALFSMKILKCDIKKFILDIKKNGIKVFGTALDGTLELKKVSKPDKFAIVLGNEAQGVKEEVLDLCDSKVKIDITDKVESLNVAIAGAIVMHYLIN